VRYELEFDDSPRFSDRVNLYRLRESVLARAPSIRVFCGWVGKHNPQGTKSNETAFGRKGNGRVGAGCYPGREKSFDRRDTQEERKEE
jgi:hypothetical protein